MGLACIVAIISVYLGIALIFCREIEIFSAKKELTGTGICYLFLISGVVKYMIDFNNIPKQATLLH